MQREAEKREAKRKAELEARAEKWADKGNTAKAEELKQEADSYFEPKVVLPSGPKTIKTESGSVTEIPDIEVDYNFEDILKAVLKGDLPVEIVSVQKTLLKKYCEKFKIETGKIPGLFIKHTTRTSYRG